MDRRSFVKHLGLGALTTSLPLTTAKAATSASPVYNVVVVGGGFGGASAAKYIKLWGQAALGTSAAINVTLVDKNPSHISCILSNLVMNGQKTLSSITFPFSTSTGTGAADKNHYTFKQGTITSIDRNGKTVSGKDASNADFTLLYDKLVLAPGIEFEFPKGMGTGSDLTTPIPHAWIAGDQTKNLQYQLSKLPTGGKAKVIMTIPKAPYRCPPGPYERACLIADYLKNKKGGGKLIVYDANKGILAEPLNFSNAFANLYSNIITYVPNRSVVEVSGSTQLGTKSVTVTDGLNKTTQTCNLLNVIPNQQAPKILFDAGLVDTAALKKWAGVHEDTYQSLFDDHIYIIGDSHDSSQPKAGHIANSEAKVCADAILRDLDWGGKPVPLPPRSANEVPVTNSACYSPITSSTASFLTAGYRFNPDPLVRKMVRVDASFGEAEAITSDNYKMMLAWANNLFKEVF